jgi:hypothetical protein
LQHSTGLLIIIVLVALYAGYLAIRAGCEVQDGSLWPLVTMAWVFWPSLLTERGRAIRVRCLLVSGIGFVLMAAFEYSQHRLN